MEELTEPHYRAIAIGLLLIIMGFVGKRWPNLIAGLNSFSLAQEELDRIDIPKVASFFRNLMIGVGIMHIVFMFIYLELAYANHDLVSLASVFVPLIIVGIWVNVLDYKKKTNEQ